MISTRVCPAFHDAATPAPLSKNSSSQRCLQKEKYRCQITFRFNINKQRWQGHRRSKTQDFKYLIYSYLCRQSTGSDVGFPGNVLDLFSRETLTVYIILNVHIQTQLGTQHSTNPGVCPFMCFFPADLSRASPSSHTAYP